jgi:hypothetical protein
MARRIPDGFRDISTTHLECRSWLHAWDFRETEIKRGGYLILKLICTRCKTYRYDTIVRYTGEVVRRQYVYPEGYTIDNIPSWGGRKEFNWNVRRTLIERLEP